MRWFALLVMALALVAAGCGGSDDDSSAADDTTIEETTTTDETTEDTTEDTTAGDTDFDFADEDCQSLVAAFVGISSAFGAAPGADFSDEIEQFSEFADEVPDEIRADVQLLGAAFSEYAEVLSDIGLQPGELPTAAQAQELQEALQSVGTDDVTAASERLNAWTTTNC